MIVLYASQLRKSGCAIDGSVIQINLQGAVVIQTFALPRIDPINRASLSANRSGGDIPSAPTKAPKPSHADHQQYRKGWPDAVNRFERVMHHGMRSRLGHTMARMRAGCADEARSDRPSNTCQAT
jgi:hypothetical protein